MAPFLNFTNHSNISLNIFKERLKTFLFRTVYDAHLRPRRIFAV